jgi:hypothetical protein
MLHVHKDRVYLARHKSREETVTIHVLSLATGNLIGKFGSADAEGASYSVEPLIVDKKGNLRGFDLSTPSVDILVPPLVFTVEAGPISKF